MKALLLSLSLALISMSVFAQITPENELISNTSDQNMEAKAMQRAALQERQASLMKQQDEARKAQDKTLKAMEIEEKNIRDAEQNLELNEEQQNQHVMAMATLKSEMNELDLYSIEDEIKTEERERNKLESLNGRKAKSIEKKKAQIASLYADIDLLESEIVQNENTIATKDLKIEQQEQLIKENDLISRTQRLEALEKEMKGLKSRHEREASKKEKAREKLRLAESNLAQARQLQAAYIKELADIRAQLEGQVLSTN